MPLHGRDNHLWSVPMFLSVPQHSQALFLPYVTLLKIFINSNSLTKVKNFLSEMHVVG